jgi:hypothetical protein
MQSGPGVFGAGGSAMSLSGREERVLDSISGQLTESDPQLTCLMDTFTR